MILTLTFNPTVDAASEADIVRPTRKIRTFDESFHPGGGGINVARVINRLGGDVIALYACGGAMGKLLSQLLQNDGIDCHVVEIAGNTRINNIVHEQSTGLEYRFIAQGPALKESECQQLIEFCASNEWDWLIVSGSLPRGVPLEIYDELIALAHKKRAKIAIDTSDAALRHVLAKGGVSLIKPSQGEFEACTDKNFQSAQEIAEEAQRLVKQGVSEIIAVTLGHQGAILATAQQTLYLPAPHVKVLSASGAGDSFVAGLVHALANHWKAEDAFRFATACGTAAVAEKGTGLSELETIKKFYRELARGCDDFPVLKPSDE